MVQYLLGQVPGVLLHRFEVDVVYFHLTVVGKTPSVVALLVRRRGCSGRPHPAQAQSVEGLMATAERVEPGHNVGAITTCFDRSSGRQYVARRVN